MVEFDFIGYGTFSSSLTTVPVYIAARCWKERAQSVTVVVLLSQLLENVCTWWTF
jgi:hypothetical protein